MGMEWYTLDDQLRRDEVIEGFESFIWTERYSAYGDFQIVTQSTLVSRRQLSVGTWIGMAGSTYVMIVRTVEDDTAEDGTRNITVTGKSLEVLLDDRPALASLSDTTTVPNWVLTGTPGAVARELFNHICVNTALDVHDTIPYYHLGTLLPTGSISEPSDSITVTVNPDTLYNALKQVCDTYALGFRLVKNGELGQIYFEVYTGNNRTTSQSSLVPVVFDPSMDSLEKVRVITSAEVIKTVAYVIAANGFQVVSSVEANPADTGYTRRVLLVNSTNNADAGPALNAALQQEGVMALAAQRTVYSFDGELPQTIPFVYGVDYGLGDLVEERNSDGVGSQMMVTEQIFSSDNTGERSYPTLVVSSVLTPGSWLSWDGAGTWDAVPDTVHWDDLP